MTRRISQQQARTLALRAQGLLGASPFPAGKAGVVQALEHLGYVQIDTISVVERAHHHVLWSRVPDYLPSQLHELQAVERRVFEYWSHAAAFLPMKDYRQCLIRMNRLSSGESHWFKRDKKVMARVLDRVRAEGPLQSRDFEPPRPARPAPAPKWFEWTPTKRALEQLFMEGKLMVSERRGFQKVYDLPERVLPASVDRTPPSPLEHAEYLIEQTLRSHGIAQEEEMRYLRKNIRKELSQALSEGLASGRLRDVTIEGQDGRKFYALSESLDSPFEVEDSTYRILSPFDNTVIQRKRLELLFGFEYLIECYVPAPKRKHGYFCLPLLKGDRFVGRIDAKADRTERRLEVHKVIFEPGHRAGSSRLDAVLKRELERFALFNGCDEIRVHSILKATSA